MSKSKKNERHIEIALGCVLRKARSEATEGGTKLQIPLSGNHANLEVLLIKRHEPELPIIDNMWELPGGKVEKNESFIDAVRREIFEETGYTVATEQLLERVYTVTREYPETRQYTFIQCSICTLESDTRQDIDLPAKVGAVRWFRFEDIDYMKMLAGSREFLIDTADVIGLPLSLNTSRTTSRAQFLCYRDDDRQKTPQQRNYVIVVQTEPNSRSLYTLTTYRKRVTWKSRGFPIVEKFTEYEELYKRLIKISKTRFSHGYKLVSWDEDFPLKTWFKENNVPVIEQTANTTLDLDTRAPVQLPLPSFLGEIEDEVDM